MMDFEDHQALHRVAIFGQYKTGTTAVYCCIKNQMPVPTTVIFEKNAPPPGLLDKNRHIIAKVILHSTAEHATHFFSSFHKFDKRVYIVRDLRDWVISGTLFSIGENQSIYGNPGALRELSEMLRKKEDHPRSVSTIDILERMWAYKQETLADLVSWLEHQLRWLKECETVIPKYFTLRYEDFAQNRLRDLSDYLGLNLQPDVVVDPVYIHVERTRSFGNWKDWFTEEDVRMFRPVLEPYLRRHGYDGNWDPAPSPKICPEHCSLYVENLLRHRKRI